MVTCHSIERDISHGFKFDHHLLLIGLQAVTIQRMPLMHGMPAHDRNAD